MDKYEFKRKLKNKLLEIYPVNETGINQLAVRCPFCGDSQKNSKSTHFYIKINLKDDEPVLFNCFICTTSGILNPSIMRTLDINDLQLNSGLLAYNSMSVKNVNTSLGITNNEFDFRVPVPDMSSDNVQKKKEYFENRLGIKTTVEEMVAMKIVFRLGEFLKYNDVETLTVNKQKALALHNDYLGFLTGRNEFINFRQVTPNNKFKRYENYSIFKGLDNTRRFYIIPNEIDLLTNEKIVINISEGPFDIQGVYHHIFDKDSNNMIYAAVCGSAYVTVIKYFIKMGIYGNVDINIFSDNDKKPQFYKKMIEELSPWINKFNIYYNDHEKENDFGVPKDRIKMVKRKL